MTSTVSGQPEQYSGTETLTYDTAGLNQVTEDQSTKMGSYAYLFGYDTAGNPTEFRSSSGLTYNADNQTSTNTYDGEGDPTTYDNQPLIFDADGDLTQVGAPSNFSAGYMADGMRAWKTNSAGTTYYLYAGGEPVIEYNSSGAITAVNTFAGGLISRTNIGGADNFYAFDPEGNVAERMDGSGNVLSADSYDAYGSHITTATAADPFGYHGEDGYYNDPETGLDYLSHRYYDPGSGRFLNRDPIGYAGGSDLYAYCGNGAFDGSDPSGCAEFSVQPWSSSGEDAGGSEYAKAAVISVLKDALAISVSDPISQLETDIDTGELIAAKGPLGAARVIGSGIYHSYADAFNSQCSYAAQGAAMGNVLFLGLTAAVGGEAAGVEGGVEAATEPGLSGTALTRSLGAEGEAGGVQRGRIDSLTGSAKCRYPDIFDEDASIIGDIKNVAVLSMSRQMADFLAFADANGWGPVFYIVRRNTVLTSTVQSLENNGSIIVVRGLKSR